jgi:hypothetical protein
MKIKKIIFTVLFMIFSLVIHAQNQMFKTPGCMCCDRWVDHMKIYGFDLEIIPSSKMDQLKEELGVPDELRGCHTTVIDGIIVEGHVPADLVAKILKDRPDGIVGIAVPGMPMGSPGMEGAFKDEYAVMVFDSKGKVQFYEMR